MLEVRSQPRTGINGGVSMKFVIAAMKFFGKKDGETIAQFSEECKALTPEDRTEMAQGLTSALQAEGILPAGESVEA